MARSIRIDILADARRVGPGVAEAETRLGKLGAVAGVAGKAVAVGLAAAGAAAVAFGASSVKAYIEAEQSSARLDDALARFPATADRSRASFDALNSSLATKTRFDDDATASGQAVLAQFQLTGTQIQQLTPLLQDYAAKTGKELPDAANVLGKALQGKGKALAEVGIKFKDAGSTGANFEQIMGGLRTQVGGFATVEGKTAAGQAEILKNQFGEVQETVGAALLPVLTRFTTFLSSTLVPGAQRVATTFATEVGPTARQLGAIVQADVLPRLQALVSGAGSVVGGFKSVVAATPTPVLQVAAVAVGALVVVLGTAAAINKTAAVATAGYTAVKAVFVTTTNLETGAVTLSTVAQARATVASAAGRVATIAQTAASVAGRAATIAWTVATTAGTAAMAVARAGAIGFAAAQTAVNVVLAANPIGLVVLALVALGAGLVLAYKKSETFRTIVNGAFSSVSSAASSVGSAIGAIADKVGDAIDAMSRLASKAASVAKSLPDLNPFGGTVPLYGSGVPLVGGYGSGLRGAGLATAALGSPISMGLLRSAPAGGAVVVVDRRSIDARVTINGAVDPVGTARQLENVLRDQAVRLGQLSAYGTA